jgi:hypothetical protein
MSGRVVARRESGAEAERGQRSIPEHEASWLESRREDTFAERGQAIIK